MKRTVLWTTISIALLAAAGFGFRGGEVVAQPAYQLVEIASGFSDPLYVTAANDGSDRLFVVEQTGTMRVVNPDGTVMDAPFLDVSDLISPEALSGGYTERGLLGLAFHPDYVENGIFFINYTDEAGNTVLARYNVSADDPNRADANSGEQLFYLQQPYSNHNGGHLSFGPDGYLYMSLGDGGSAGDPQNNGQDLTTLLGTLLRLDVDTEQGYAIPEDNPFVDRDDARPEIWAWGLRNVWRFSFDRETGDLLHADVGQNQWEEVNFQPASSSGGENYGWNVYEGTHRYSDAEPASEVVMPVLEYDHSGGACSVTGGYVYRGDALPDLQGTYFYGDWCSGTIWAATQDDAGNWTAEVSMESGRPISSFGEDEAGELYVVDYNGSLLRLEP